MSEQNGCWLEQCSYWIPLNTRQTQYYCYSAVYSLHSHEGTEKLHMSESGQLVPGKDCSHCGISPLCQSAQFEYHFYVL
jgi:hypothetical protein